MAHADHLRGRVASSLGRTAFTSRANCLKMRWEAGLELRPGCRRLRAAPGSPQPPRLDGGPRSSLAEAAVAGGPRCPAGDPHEAGPANPPREAGLASGPREVNHTILGAGRGLP